MKKTLILLGLLLFCAKGANAMIDLTPTAAIRVLEGCKFPQVRFHDGDKTISYEPPRDWDYSAEGTNKFVLHATGKVQTEARIEVIPTTEPSTFDEKQIKKLQEEFTLGLPKDAQEIKVAEPVIDRLRINGHRTCELSASYVLYARAYAISVMFVELSDFDLRFSLSCLSADYEGLHKAFVNSWYTWEWL